MRRGLPMLEDLLEKKSLRNWSIQMIEFIMNSHKGVGSEILAETQSCWREVASGHFRNHPM
jgi:hypothetical protein